MSRSSNKPLNPHDLLFSNQFISTKIINNQEINNNIKNYQNYQNFLKKNENNTKKYLNTNLLRSDPINLNRSNRLPWPSYKNSNTNPILSAAVQDMSKDKYKKNYKTLISINSSDRNISNSTIPNNYDIKLNKEYKNVTKIALKDIIIPNSVSPINDENNIFIWQYSTVESLRETGACSTLIPSKNNIIDITNQIMLKGSGPFLSKKIYFTPQESNSDQQIYSRIFKKGYYSTNEFMEEFRSNLKYTMLNIRNRDDPCFIDISDCGICLTTGICNPNPNICNNSTNLIDTLRKYKLVKTILTNQESKNNLNTLFMMDINIINNEIKIINRIEEIPILAIKSTINSCPDILDPSLTLEKNSIYIYLLQSNFLNQINFFLYILPLIITGINSIGGIDKSILNYTPLFNYEIYEKSNYAPFFDNKVPEYVSSFQIETPGTVINTPITQIVQRIKLSFSSGNVNDNFFTPNGKLFKINKSETIYYNNSFKNIVESGINLSDKNGLIYFNKNEIQQMQENNYPLIGRGIPFRLLRSSKFLEKKYSGFNGYSKTILDAIGWGINNKENSLNEISLFSDFKFVHRNIDKIILSQFNQIKTDNVPQIIDYRIPQLKLPIENYKNKYYFKSIPFIFIKIILRNNKNFISNHLKRGRKIGIIEEDISYQKKFYEKIDIEQTSDDIYYKNTEFLFAKIYLNQSPFKSTILNNINNEILFYDKPLESFSEFRVIITDPFGKILNLETEHSFTLEISQTLNILKDTLIDSQRGNINTTGIKEIY